MRAVSARKRKAQWARYIPGQARVAGWRIGDRIEEITRNDCPCERGGVGRGREGGGREERERERERGGRERERDKRESV